MAYLFTSESVSEGHPDKVADQISDAILDEFLRQDPHSKVACETFVITAIDEQSTDIAMGVNKALEAKEHLMSEDEIEAIGAGDQGMMFGYACNDTEEYMPLPLFLAHLALVTLADIRKNSKLMPYLRPDAKSQFTIEYSDDHTPLRVHTIVISTQHDEFDTDEAMQQLIKSDVKNILIPKMLEKLSPAVQELFNKDYRLLVNPTGKFVIGGPHGDTGLTGRKIIVDTYGGKGAHGGGAFSGKDSSKVDRSAAYAARYIAKNLVAAGVADQILIQLAYAIGVARPVSVNVNSYGTAKVTKNGKVMTDGEIAEIVEQLFDLRPAKIVEKFGLTNPIFEPTASYGHFGRTPYVKDVEVIENRKPVKKSVQFFGWELLDSVDMIKKAFFE